MKRNLTKILAFLLTLIFNVSSIFAQGVEENTDMRNFLNNMFSTLDKTKVPDGLLRDFSFELVDLDKYSGTLLNKDNFIDRPTYEMFLRTIKSASVSSAPFGDVETIMLNQGNAGTNTTVSLSAAAYRYSFIKANAKNDQLINYANGKVSDNVKNGVWQNPYSSGYALGFAPHDSIFNAESLTYKLNSNVWFSNLSYSKIEIDPGDGGGYRQITLGGSLTANYPSSGRKEVKMRVTLTGGNQLLSHSNIQVLLPTAAASAFGIGSTYSYATTKVGAAYNGVSTSAEVYTICRVNNIIKKPLIVVEGFDPRVLSVLVEKDPDTKLKGKGVVSVESFMKVLKRTYEGDRILDEYDIVYVDFVNSDEYIQANANTLKEVILWVNQQKQQNNSSEPNIVMGQSMGGLIARYALKKMELANIAHKTSIYVSHDAPHLGANVPLGVLYGVYAINSFLDNKSIINAITNQLDANDYIQMVKRVMHSNAARQMLVNYIDFGGNLNNTDHNNWQQELASLGFPNGDANGSFRMLSIVNGSYVSNSINPYFVDANVNANSPLLDFTPGLNGIVLGVLLQDIWAGLLTILPGKTTLQVKMQMLPGISVGTKISDFQIKYVKKFLWTVPITRTIFSFQRNMPSGLLFDTYPSSVYSINNQANLGQGSGSAITPILLKYGYDVKIAPNIPFLPASSALAVGFGTQPLTAAMFTTKPVSTNTPFGGNVFYNDMVSNGHIDFGMEEARWLLAQLRYSIAGPRLGKTGSQYSVINPGTASITWSTSNSSIATINSSGVLTVTGKGIIDITANVNGTQLTTRVAVGTPRFVLADVVRKPGFYTIKANCIDTEPGYADFIMENKNIVVYQWGVKNEDGPIEWFDSQSPEVKLGTTEDNDNTTIYLKVRDANGNESAPVFVRITGYDVWNLLFNSWIVNNKGEVFTSTGIKVTYNNATMAIIRRNATGEYANARWNPLAAVIVNDEGSQRGILWSPNGYIKDILPPEELERIKAFPNNQVLVYRLMLLNYQEQIIQKTPFTVVYKENYPN
ncbi:hypothetical protein [Sphingobacterium sp. UBA1498]|uniref:alpha/beta hydrolase n=1 Tax=Sphingobacterium sp. UBA1498 TaxID=1947481 RepID=UPI0025D2E503|nr:hypothetical protein [Sphingobacterium sp. UBA1498]